MQELLEKYSPDEFEIEVRFGKFTKGFTPSLGDDEYKRITTFLKANPSFYKHSVQEQKIENIKNIRKITTDGNTIFNEKTKVETMDLKDWGFRVSVSKETEAKETKAKPTRVLERTRHTFENSKNKTRIDIDIDQEGTKTVEVECLPGCKFLNLKKEIDLILKIINESEYLAPYSMLNAALKHYKEITGSNKFIGVQPKTLRDEKFNKKEKYAITKKLDGQRYLLMPFKGDIYTISSKMKISWTPYKTSTVDDTYIFDTEYYSGYYHIFDIVQPGKKDLISRLLEAKEFVKTITFPKDMKPVVMKDYSFTNNIKELYSTFKKLEKDLDHKVYDGLILVESNKDYKNSNPLKWKPILLNTIDFQVHKKEENKFDLLVTTKEGLQVFAETEVSKTDYEKFNDGDIAEFSYKNEKWVPLRPRMDKLKPNFIDVANDNFGAVLCPFSPENTFHDKTALFNLRRFHNNIKRMYIQKYRGHSVLDLACGKGGDFGKYVDSGFSNVYGFDINEESIKEAGLRASKIEKKKGTNVVIKLETRNLIKKPVTELESKVDLVVCNFAFHYFYKNLDSFLKSVNLNIKKGGFLLLTFFDGKLIKELKTDDYIVKKSGKEKISVWMKDSVLSKPELEYIVDVEKVVEMFKKNNLELVERVHFKDLYQDWNKIDCKNSLTKEEKDLSFMNNAVVFKKTS